MKSAIVISERDNVATALRQLEPGLVLDLGDISVKVSEVIPSGHKIALRSIAAGEPIVKYGSPIGTASIGIAAGAHVHTHNVASSRGRGDLDATATAGGPRLAEPPDDAAARDDVNTPNQGT